MRKHFGSLLLHCGCKNYFENIFCIIVNTPVMNMVDLGCGSAYDVLCVVT